MPTVVTDGVSLRYDVEGEGEPLVFVNDAGVGAWLWSYLRPAMTGPYRTVVWDLRGAGESDNPDGPCALETFVDDLETIVSTVEGRHVHLVGAGFGGVIALEYARAHDHVASLGLLGTAAGTAVDADALASLAAPLDDPDALERSLESVFAPGVREDYPAEMARIAEWRARDDADREGWDAHRAAWLEVELEALYEITTSALVMSGAADRIVDPTATARLAEALPRGTHRRIDGGHLFPVSESRAVADELLSWLDERTDRPA